MSDRVDKRVGTLPARPASKRRILRSNSPPDAWLIPTDAIFFSDVINLSAIVTSDQA
ncbi:hypothetical protein SH139x_004205 [Planctomycetaceae bacterium SH139]